MQGIVIEITKVLGLINVTEKVEISFLKGWKTIHCHRNRKIIVPRKSLSLKWSRRFFFVEKIFVSRKNYRIRLIHLIFDVVTLLLNCRRASGIHIMFSYF